MNKLLPATVLTGAMLAAAPALAQQTATGLPTVRHLVYQFGYNTKAAKSGTGTGTTTIDIVGLAKDGGMTVKYIPTAALRVRRLHMRSQRFKSPSYRCLGKSTSARCRQGRPRRGNRSTP
jgi:hypothetical protein